MVTVGINGFGRIGRMCLRVCLERDVEVKHINDPFISPDYMTYLFKYDSTHGTFKGNIDCHGTTIIINERTISTSYEKEPSKIKWQAAGVQYVIEATGVFTDLGKAKLHLEGGADRVVITAPSRDAVNLVFGVNHQLYEKGRYICASAASCTTNCAAPIMKLMHENYDIEEAMISTIHAVTANQKIVDGPTGRLWRDGRSGMQNIIPSSTGVGKCIGKIIPELRGKVSAIAFRVPISNVSLCDMTFRVKRPVTYEQVKKLMKDAANGQLKNVLGYTEDDCVSSDFNHTPYSCVYDAKAAVPHTSSFVKVVAWYDNEYGYANRVIDLLLYMYDVEHGKKSNTNDSSSSPSPVKLKKNHYAD